MAFPVAYRIERDDIGTGEPSLVLIPGWCGDRTVFGPLLPGLATTHRTIAVDLPEHGSSPQVGADFGTAEVVEELLAMVRQEGLERIVPVSLSHAGWAAIELRRRLGAQHVPGIVFLDWMPLGMPPGFAEALVGLQDEQSWEQVRAGLFGMWTTGVDMPALLGYVSSMGEYGYQHWRRAGREIAAGFAAEGSPLASLERLESPCPTLHLYAQPPDPGYLAAQQGYAAAHPWFRVHHLSAESHFPMFEVPEQMTTIIDEFLCSLT